MSQLCWHGGGLTFGLLWSVVCFTGALIVYKVDLEQVLVGQFASVSPNAPRLPFQVLFERVQTQYPGAEITTLYLPPNASTAPYFRLLTHQGRFEGRTYAYVDPSTGRVTAEDKASDSWFAWLYELHERLLLGKTGLTLNGLCAFLLIAVALSGLVVWWPGKRQWTNGFRYESRARWKRKNYDLHKLIGFASALVLVLVSFTGAYYAFPQEYKTTAAALLGPSANWTPPKLSQVPDPDHRETLDRLLTIAQTQMPEAQLRTVSFPKKPHEPVTVRLKLPSDWSRQGNQLVYLNPYSTAVVKLERHAEQPLSVRFIRSMGPLHFGTFGGHPIRILWMLVGFAMPGLFVTGVLMYWNRYLSKQWARVRSRSTATPQLAPSGLVER